MDESILKIKRKNTSYILSPRNEISEISDIMITEIGDHSGEDQMQSLIK